MPVAYEIRDSLLIDRPLHRTLAASRLAAELMSRSGFQAYVTRDLDDGLRWLGTQSPN